MLTTVEGIYENGEVRLLEPIPRLGRARVVVTVLPDSLSTAPPDSPSSQGSKPEGPAAKIASEDSEMSELGQALMAIRQRAIARGMPLSSVDVILDEVLQGRAEAGDDQDLR